MEVFHTLLVVFFSLLFTFYGMNVEAGKPLIRAIYQFGDSISDTGNTFKEAPGVGCSRPPYGQSFFHHPTGRCSDGLLIVDYLAEAFRIPLVSPYLNKSGDFRHGVNFAVAGATAIDIRSLAEKNITAVSTPSSLLVQLGWFKSHLATICSKHSECKQKLENALFIVGGIGGNDYNSGGLAGKSIQDLHNLVADVVKAISHAVKKLIGLRATRIVVPGSFPVGCMPFVVGGFNRNDPALFDELGCVKGWNDFAALHNAQLQRAMITLQQHHPEVKIIYGDYFSALKSLFQNATSLGFDKNGLFEACCSMCGSADGKACPNPNVRVSWDGIHLTTYAYRIISMKLMKQMKVLYTPS